MKKEKILGLIIVIFTLCFTFSCQDDEDVIINENGDTLSNTSALSDTLTSVTTADTQISSDCITLNYPITVFGYNSGFQLENTYLINSNGQLYAMLVNLGDNEYYAIDYPISITVSGNEVITVTNNNELLLALQEAIENCTPINECDNPQVLVNDMVIYMPFSNSFDDLMGATVSSSSSITFVEDRDGNANCAVSFQGNQEFLQVASTPLNEIVDGDYFSVSVWFRMQNTEVGDLETIFRKGNTGDGFTLNVYDMNTPMSYNNTYSLWDDDWNMDSTLYDDVDNWHHLVLTLDSDDMLKLYRDGELRNSMDFAESSIDAQAMDYFIGQWFEGYLDDLRVYKRSLSAAEVQTLYELDGDCHTCLE